MCMARKPARTAWARIKEALIEAGYEGKQSEIEAIFGIKQPSVSEWNRIGVTPALDNAIAIGLKLNVCVEWILTEREPKRPGPPADPIAQELWNLWGRLDPEDKQRVLGFAEGRARPTLAARSRAT